MAASALVRPRSKHLVGVSLLAISSQLVAVSRVRLVPPAPPMGSESTTCLQTSFDSLVRQTAAFDDRHAYEDGCWSRPVLGGWGGLGSDLGRAHWPERHHLQNGWLPDGCHPVGHYIHLVPNPQDRTDAIRTARATAWGSASAAS